jgi:hypothetical protein
MNNKQFTRNTENLLSVCTSILLKKGGEYASDVDRLANFKLNTRSHRNSVDNWEIYYNKGGAAINSFTGKLLEIQHSKRNTVEKAELIKKLFDGQSEAINLRFADLINYSLLGSALFQEIYDEANAITTEMASMHDNAKDNP